MFGEDLEPFLWTGFTVATFQSTGMELDEIEEEKRSWRMGERAVALSLKNLFGIESGPGAE